MSTVTTNFLSLAVDDYRAARLLLRQGLLPQGVALASTAVEKQIKAILSLKGSYTKKHLDSGLRAMAINHYPDLDAQLDKDFIKFLGKGFDLRYASVDGPGYTIVINQYRTLVELDRTMLAIDGRIKVRFDGMPSPTPMRRALQASDSLLLEDNVAAGSATLEGLARKNNKMFELRVGRKLQTLIATYETEGLNVNGRFCKRTDMDFDKSEFQLARG